MNHILLECYCLKETDCNKDAISPPFCKSKEGNPSYNCIVNECQYLDYTNCDHTLCYIGQDSEMEYGISFGGDMESREENKRQLIERWKELSIRKIDEAYCEYMKFSKYRQIPE